MEKLLIFSSVFSQNEEYRSSVQNQMYTMPEMWQVNGKFRKYKLVTSEVHIQNIHMLELR